MSNPIWLTKEKNSIEIIHLNVKSGPSKSAFLCKLNIPLTNFSSNFFGKELIEKFRQDLAQLVRLSLK